MIKKIFIIAGEASGDLLGSKFLDELAKNSGYQFQIIGVGGDNIKKSGKQFGFQSIFPLEDLSVMGLFEIIPHLPKLIKRINFTVEKIIEFAPDYLITIDSPDFCFRVLKKLKKTSSFGQIKKIHFIAPSVWAYREGRAKKVSQLYDLLFAILPFEPPYFEKYGLKTVFIGHPLVDNPPNFSEQKNHNDKFKKTYQLLEDDKLILLTPGSRIGEVKKIFPEFIEAINLLKNHIHNLKVIIPVVRKTHDLVKQLANNIKVPYVLITQEQKKSALFATNFAIAKSGTNAVEISLYNIPLIIAYKINRLTHFFIKRMVKIRFANLLNLLANQEIIPELLQDKCNPQNICDNILYLIKNDQEAKLQIQQAHQSLKKMGLNSIRNPMEIAVAEILK